MLKSVMATGLLIAAAVEPITGDMDLTRYAITQGGLFAVCLVLLWYIREIHRDRALEDRQRIEALTSLVAQTNRTMEKNISVGEAQEKAIDRLARVLEGR